MGYWLLLLTTGLVGEAEDQPHIALRDHDGSDRGPGDVTSAVRAGADWTLKLVESPVATARAVIYSMPSTTARVGRLKRSTRAGVGALFSAFADRCPIGYEEGVLVAMTRLFCSRPWGSG